MAAAKKNVASLVEFKDHSAPTHKTKDSQNKNKENIELTKEQQQKHSHKTKQPRNEPNQDNNNKNKMDREMDSEITNASFIIRDGRIDDMIKQNYTKSTANNSFDDDDDDESIELEPLTRQKSSRTLGVDFELATEDGVHKIVSAVVSEPPELCTTTSIRITNEMKQQPSSLLRLGIAELYGGKQQPQQQGLSSSEEQPNQQGNASLSTIESSSESTLLMEPDESWLPNVAGTNTSSSASHRLSPTPRRRSSRQSATAVALSRSRNSFLAACRMATNECLAEQEQQHEQQQEHRQRDDSPLPRTSTGVEIVEVAPGLIAQFVGTTDTTWDAILDGHVIVVLCTCCNVELHCMDVLQLIVCPECKVVSPIQNNHHEDGHAQQLRQGGGGGQHEHHPNVGVGFTTQTIVEWMEEISS